MTTEQFQSLYDLLALHLSVEGMGWGFTAGVTLGVTMAIWNATKAVFDDTDRDL